MRKQRVMLLALAAAMTASLATGCGGKKAEEKTETGTETGAAVEETLRRKSGKRRAKGIYHLPEL